MLTKKTKVIAAVMLLVVILTVTMPAVMAAPPKFSHNPVPAHRLVLVPGMTGDIAYDRGGTPTGLVFDQSAPPTSMWRRLVGPPTIPIPPPVSTPR